jgi:hypothetical protein
MEDFILCSVQISDELEMTVNLFITCKMLLEARYLAAVEGINK